MTDPNVYTEFVGLIPTGTGQITVSCAPGAGGEVDVNGFQLVPLVPLITFVWSGSGGSAGNGSWDLTTTNNWALGSLATTYSNGNSVIFSDTGSNTNVIITSSGVSPSSVQFTNNTLAYSFSGGAITGTAPVLLSGTGFVTFSSSNSYSGGTTISAGTLVAAANAALGSGAVNVGVGGTLDFVIAAPSHHRAHRQRQRRVGHAPFASNQPYLQRQR